MHPFYVQGGSILTLDFSSLLGPLFFSWLLQLLLPPMLNQLVYEKEKVGGWWGKPNQA
jgi:hypothetical protein